MKKTKIMIVLVAVAVLTLTITGFASAQITSKQTYSGTTSITDSGHG